MNDTTTRARHRAPWSITTTTLEAIARSLAPSAGASSDLVVRHLNETVALHGRHAAKPTPTSRVLNLAAFRSMHSDVQVTR